MTITQKLIYISIGYYVGKNNIINKTLQSSEFKKCQQDKKMVECFSKQINLFIKNQIKKIN